MNLCGNNTINPPEQCDGTNLNSQSCASLGLGSGTLSCNAGSCTFNTSGCSAGCDNDGIREPAQGEQCDGSDLGGNNCTTIPGGFTGGNLSCNASCNFNTSACTAPSGGSCTDDGVTPDTPGFCDGSTGTLDDTCNGDNLQEAVCTGDICQITTINCAASGGTCQTDTSGRGFCTTPSAPPPPVCSIDETQLLPLQVCCTGPVIRIIDPVTQTEIYNENVCTLCDFLRLVHRIMNFTVALLTPLLVLLMIVVGGFLMLISLGSPGRFGTGRNMVKWAILGFAVVLTSWIVINSILMLVGIAAWVSITQWWQITC